MPLSQGLDWQIWTSCKKLGHESPRTLRAKVLAGRSSSVMH